LKNPCIARLVATLVSVSMGEMQRPDFLSTRILHPFLAIYATEPLLCLTGERTFYNTPLNQENSLVVSPFWVLGNP